MTIFFNGKTLHDSEFSGISLERAFGIPESHFQGKMKLICWAAGSYTME